MKQQDSIDTILFSIGQTQEAIDGILSYIG